MTVAGEGAHGAASQGTESQEAAAKEACLRLLTDRARSRTELSDRLAKKGYPPVVIERVLDRLAAVGLVDDAAFADQWVHSRHTFSGRGKRALAMELRRKGIDEQTSARALEQVSADDERERATELVRKKLGRIPSVADRDERDRVTRRLVGMLARRGYPPSMAFDVVKQELAGLPEDEGPDFDGAQF
ncbi:recombination regulator RecX [Rhodococcus sp. D2-41]|uniref:Regulatory protein RecX n=1 Tax=Speluncibacter jeojiensis TaxID=2710754 RepID=A0A9X4LYX8_9ACTN|nr:recombination regulator RecX [Rhodococcus sp. D2-41]MDG3010761.1 recombination regulator RecX [Rhodococcus sp. D2-41]MDG3013742.1 recombination regulator RecX [Corynebacteriales bacterium D3-21]